MSVKCVNNRVVLVIALAVMTGSVLLAACSSEEASPPEQGTLQLVITPTTIELVQGATGHAEIAITRGGSFTGAVGLVVSGNPAGMSVSTGYIYAGSTTAVVDIAVDATVAPGTKTIEISAVGDGPTAVTATATMTVVVSIPSGSLSLSAEPTTLTAEAGAAAVTSTIALTRTAPFADAADLTVIGAPPGVTASLSPGSVFGDASTLSVSVAPDATNGTHLLVIRGTGAGIADAIAFVLLTITGGTTRGLALGFDPASLAVTAGGGSATSLITLIPPFTRGLNLRVSGMPAGLAASFSPSTLRTTSTLTVQASDAVAPGIYILTVTGQAANEFPTASTKLPVVVSAAPTLHRSSPQYERTPSVQ